MSSVEWCGENVRVCGRGPVGGRVQLPGSKSLTNRYLTCAALADGASVLQGASVSDDVLAMASGLDALGISTTIDTDAGEITVRGRNGNLTEGEAEIDIGHAGTAMRFLTALACLGWGQYRLDGSERMRQRPIGPLVDALRTVGARIGYDLNEGCPPLTVMAGGLDGGEVHFREPPSSQYLSALLMVAPYARRDVMIAVEGELPSRPYVDMTIDVMRELGVELVETDGNRFIVPATQRYRSGTFAVEPDASAATYLWAAAAITGGEITVTGLSKNSRQGDVHFVDVLERMGCTSSATDDTLTVRGPAAGGLAGIDVDLNAMPDTAQTLAITALFAAGPTTIRNVANLRVKETDRIAAVATELTRVGARVETTDDAITVHPPAALRSAEISTYDDHRMAMSFSLAGLQGTEILIRDATCVSKSFPRFFEVLRGVVGRDRGIEGAGDQG